MSRWCASLVHAVLLAALACPFLLSQPGAALAQGQRIEPNEVALRPADLPPNFAVANEDARPMTPVPGLLYSISMERPLDEENLSSGPVGVFQVIARFDRTPSYEGFLDEMRRQAVEQEGYRLVPGAPNDGGTASLQKIEGDVASFQVGFIKRDMVIFTGWVGRRGVVSLQGVLTLAGVTSNRYDEVLMARTGVPVPGASATAASSANASPSSASTAPAGQQGRIANTGGTGANVRAQPQVNSDLLHVIYDGETVELIGVEERGADGRGWRNIRTASGVQGWIVAEYVDGGGQVQAAAAPPTATPVRPASAPATRTGGTIDSRLEPALRALYGIKRGPSGGRPWGDVFRELVSSAGPSITIDTLPSGIWGSYRGSTNTVTVSRQALAEDVRAIATIVAHELTHVFQVTNNGAGTTGDCVAREVEALQTELVIWVNLFEGYAPGRSQFERTQNALVRLWLDRGDPILYRLVVESPGYQDQCRLWVP